ncbi:hypothetical protein PRK78_003695 [Emydomyces testavorans]|uniref:Uncharacterized protein n=1 Tax=Emydomyces testavorans TaxID=2070801 RepID=A0AAF0IIT0_9EURO|nr:hypothetical protein PRK78_003695 [Emydomyces testavorans]
MEGTGDFFKAFFATSDDGTAHDKYPLFFTEDAKLIMGDKVGVGHAEILTVRQGMWAAVSSRHHTYTYFTSPEAPNTVMLAGNVKYGMKDGSQKDTDWVAKAIFEGEGKHRKLGFYQVFLVSLGA